MACGRSGILPAIFSKRKQVESSSSSKEFLENGSMLLEDLLAFSNGRYDIPIRRFSIDELSQATNGFCSDSFVFEQDSYKIYKGSFEERLIFIKKHHDRVGSIMQVKSECIRDLVMMAVMSSHKNVLKVIGCCLDFEFPALVCEYPAAAAAAGTSSSSSIRQLSSLLYGSKEEEEGMVVEEINGSKLNWKSRMKIANEIANVVVYMHTAFPTPIIHRNLTPDNIIIDQCGVARVSDFSFSISIPPGETQVELDIIDGTLWFMSPGFLYHQIVSENSDIYCFGMFLFTLLSGKSAFELNDMFRDESLDDSSEEPTNKHPRDFGPKFYEFLYDFFANMDQLNNVVDPTILQEIAGGIDEQDQQQQFRAFAALALRCVQRCGDRPEMIEVAKELRQMLKSVYPASSSSSSSSSSSH